MTKNSHETRNYKQRTTERIVRNGKYPQIGPVADFRTQHGDIVDVQIYHL